MPPDSAPGGKAQDGGDKVVPPEHDLQKNSEGEVFGVEGTNKTLPEPLGVDESEVQPGGDGKYVPPTPYTRKV